VIFQTPWRRIREFDRISSLEFDLTLFLLVKRALHSGVHRLLF